MAESTPPLRWLARVSGGTGRPWRRAIRIPRPKHRLNAERPSSPGARDGDRCRRTPSNRAPRTWRARGTVHCGIGGEAHPGHIQGVERIASQQELGLDVDARPPSPRGEPGRADVDGDSPAAARRGPATTGIPVRGDPHRRPSPGGSGQTAPSMRLFARPECAASTALPPTRGTTAKPYASRSSSAALPGPRHEQATAVQPDQGTAQHWNQGRKPMINS